jgi:hypothetical protein
MRKTPILRRFYRPRLELLENREAPSVTPWAFENFDSTPVGQIPSNWSQWASDSSTQATVENTDFQSAPNGLGLSGSSSVSSRAWLNNSVLSDVDVTASLEVNVPNPAQIIARGQNLNSSTDASYYALQIVGGMTVSLVKVSGPTETTLTGGSVTTADSFNNIWVRATLDINNANDQNIRAQVQRLDTNQWLDSNGNWQNYASWCVAASDSSINGPGQVGLGQWAQFSGTVYFDDFQVGFPNNTENFDTTRAGAMPSDKGYNWYVPNNGAQTFFVSSARAQSNFNEVVSNAEASSQKSYTWAGITLPTDSRVSVSMYLDSLQPVLLFTRGNGNSLYNMANASFYGVELTRGMTAKLIKVANGFDNNESTLVTVTSTTSTANLWVQVTLDVQGNSLSAQVYRPDTNQFLNSSGAWQATPTWGLTYTDTNNPLTSGGIAGLARPHASAGSVSLDDFSFLPASTDFTAPTVSITAPAAGGGYSNTVTVTASASDNVRIAKVEFYVDNALETTLPYGTSYSWSFDTRSVYDGTHTLTVKAYDLAGNFAVASENITTSNSLTTPRPSFPKHYSSVRVAQLAYSPWGDWSAKNHSIANSAAQLLTGSVDLVVPDSAYLGAMQDYAANTPKMIYTNISNLYENLLLDWLSYADAHGYNRAEAFFHVNAATSYSHGSEPGSSHPVRQLWGAYREDATGTPITWTNYLDGITLPSTTVVSFGATGQLLYLGYPDRFRELNFNVQAAAGAGWTYALEYPTAVDGNGVATAWATLTPITNPNFSQAGTTSTTFDPPSNWVAASVDGSARMFYVRYRTTSSSGAAPTAKITGRDYTGAGDSEIGTIPAFDYNADTDHDGYLNDTEYANRAAGKDARFAYEARLLMSGTGEMRPATDAHTSDFRNWAADFNYRLLQGNPLAGGLFVDNSTGSTSNDFLQTTNVVESSDIAQANYKNDFASTIKAIYQKIAPRWLLPNSGGYSTADPIITSAGAEYWEFGIRARKDDWASEFAADASHVTEVKNLNTTNPPYQVIDSYPQNSTSGGYTYDEDEVTQYDTLAYYYVLATPSTNFLDFFGGYNPEESWVPSHWNAAVTVDIGAPTDSGYTTFEHGLSDPGQADNTFEYYVYQRLYTNALVLYKPLSYSSTKGKGVTGSASQTTTDLGGTYYLLSNDGKSTTAVTQVTLEDGQGAILLINDLNPSSSSPGGSGPMAPVDVSGHGQASSVAGHIAEASSIPFTVSAGLVNAVLTTPLESFVGSGRVMDPVAALSSVRLSSTPNADLVKSPMEQSARPAAKAGQIYGSIQATSTIAFEGDGPVPDPPDFVDAAFAPLPWM